MFKMTKAAALAKQAEQVAHYARIYPMRRAHNRSSRHQEMS
jgi:hypothetical protein